MAGVPVRRGDAYMNRLLKKGYKVAICQQVENPKNEKGLVKRRIVRVATPGTVLDEEVLDAGINNYLVGIWSHDQHAVAVVDLSTGEFRCTSGLDQSAFAGGGEGERLHSTPNPSPQCLGDGGAHPGGVHHHHIRILG